MTVPLASDEATTLRGFLDHHRDTLRRQASGLTDEQLHTRLAPSTLTLGGLLKHLAFVENYWARYVLAGEDQSEPWASADWASDPDWELTSAAAETGAQLRSAYDLEVAAADAVIGRVLADGGLDALAARARPRDDARASLRWILVHLVEEYARHCGHADLIRESIDGAVDL